MKNIILYIIIGLAIVFILFLGISLINSNTNSIVEDPISNNTVEVINNETVIDIAKSNSVPIGQAVQVNAEIEQSKEGEGEIESFYMLEIELIKGSMTFDGTSFGHGIKKVLVQTDEQTFNKCNIGDTIRQIISLPFVGSIDLKVINKMVMREHY